MGRHERLLKLLMLKIFHPYHIAKSIRVYYLGDGCSIIHKFDLASESVCT